MHLENICYRPRWSTWYYNKTVLLRERKTHTARCVASTHYAVPVGVPPCPGAWPGWGGGYPIPGVDGGYHLPRSWQGVPPSQVWMRGVSTHFPGLDEGVPPSQVWMGGTHFPGLDRGYPHWLDGVPLSGRIGVPPLGRLGLPPTPTDVNRLKILPSLILRMGVVIITRQSFCVTARGVSPAV